MSVRHAPARARGLRDHRGAVGVDVGDRVRQVPRVRERPPVAGVVAAQALARALEQVADEDAGREPVPVVPRPAVLVRERREEQRRVGDPAGDHDVGALRERVGDRARAEVRGREQRRRGHRRRTASPVSRCANASPVGVQRRRAAASRSSPSTVAIVMPRDAQRPRGLDRGARRRGRVDAARVGDDLRAAVGDVRQRARRGTRGGRACSRASRRAAGPSAGSRASARRALRGRGSRRLRRAARRPPPACRRRSPARPRR